MHTPKLTLAQVQWTEENVPFSERFDDFYFSTDDGLQEVEYVFLKHNFLAQRFGDLSGQKTFRIAETGFGSGLNFLSVAKLWLEIAPKGAQLHFISFEKYPLTVEDLQRAHQSYPTLSVPAKELRDHFPLLLPGWHDVWLFEGRIRLTLWFGDVLKGLPECDASIGSKVDAWLLDGFTPSKNPQMWQPPLYQQMARLSHSKTTFATFTSAGEVRRGLQKVGFEVKKDVGYGKKREMCFGSLVQQRPFSLKAPWFSRPEPVATGRAIVIGAGLAGAGVANKLAEAGWKVTVLEAQGNPATQASGNLAGAVHPLVTADWNLRSQWYLQGFEATLRTLLPWLQKGEILGDLTGLVQLAVTEVGAKRVEEAFARVGLPMDFAEQLTIEKTKEKIGGQAAVAGLFFPQGGWVNPPSVVRRCLRHPNIEVHYLQEVKDFKRVGNGWQVVTQDGSYQAESLVVATGSLNVRLNERLELPIRPVKGQVTHLTETQQNWSLNCAVTHEGYSAPCGEGMAVTGATFEAPDMSEILSEDGHQANLQQAAKALPGWLNAESGEVEGRIAFRPTTPDHLPIVGAVADPEWIQEAYVTQSHTHAVYRYPPQKYLPGLFVSNGHGPRGLMSVFLAAESIVADLQGDALPQPLSLYHASHPARFVIRQWRSGHVGRQTEDE
ncbi:bifunctional tRNA (5-methylaminomethyl-2-thiouridine)(34)-methyltransferase MnmD/FAD-dependent 5-carboxymethylaminomethyl-2-thiouridine(34) oxidoreductase MnmC [Thiomicrorhabdus sp.]|uniref:bifunctional tRNA (5-methylaminomethyl-2-thiouridine)(34)-methyltransferase MnmD/FAD-dependent 5-carboxymethylaminomethyl-2-thiouridine(34) oxidoreductase MnmC n=1 Tax=Thiomicrorhabdus sp. TaxID=2039724 RepID=UPI003563BA06